MSASECEDNLYLEHEECWRRTDSEWHDHAQRVTDRRAAGPKTGKMSGKRLLLQYRVHAGAKRGLVNRVNSSRLLGAQL